MNKVYPPQFKKPATKKLAYTQQSKSSARRTSGEVEEPMIICDEGQDPMCNNAETWNAKRIFEVNFDGIIGPTHNYSGLSLDNVACLVNKHKKSNPKHAALQGLKKMKFLADLGLKQAVLPPHERPLIPFLRKIGFEGSEGNILNKAFKEAPWALSAASSASAMWTANAATVVPSIDTLDQKVHIVPANLVAKAHRSLEASVTKEIFKKIFSNSRYFVVHDPLPAAFMLADEGAANHTRLAPSHKHPHGLHLFVYATSYEQTDQLMVKSSLGRQTLEASKSVAQLLQLQEEQCLFIPQNPSAIKKGVFHNDVISVGNEFVFLHHEDAFLNTALNIKHIKDRYFNFFNRKLMTIKIPRRQVSLEKAVSTYLFNSQIVTLTNNTMALICPQEVQEDVEIRSMLETFSQNKYFPIQKIYYLDVHQSMRNGGGPACLRLRILLNEKELAAIHPNILLNNDLYKKIFNWINKHYRDELQFKDLADPLLLKESLSALDELTSLLNLGSVYAFQRE